LIEGFGVIFPDGGPSIPLPARATREQREEKIIPPGLSQRFVLNRASDLPEDWQAHVSDEGVPYYHNTITKESTWVRPLPVEDDDKQEGKSRVAETKPHKVRAGGARPSKIAKSGTAYGSDFSGDSSDEDGRGSHMSPFEESASSMMGDSALSELKRLARAKAVEIRKAKKELSSLEDKLSQRESELLVPRKSGIVKEAPPLVKQGSAKLEIVSSPKSSMTTSASTLGTSSFVGNLLAKKPPGPPAVTSKKPPGNSKVGN